MIPGNGSTRLSEVTAASAATVGPVKADVLKLTGTTQVDTILPGLGKGFNQHLILIPVSGSIILSTAGNILVGITAVINRSVYLYYSKLTDKWYINSGV